jgi:pimeloyl-ACP methyl ester carboxylesterase
VCPPELSRDIAASVPDARIAVVEKSGHYVTLERPELVASELTAWLARPATTLH